MLGYAERYEDLALADIMRGELRTGDLGSFDEDGFFGSPGARSASPRSMGCG